MMSWKFFRQSCLVLRLKISDMPSCPLMRWTSNIAMNTIMAMTRCSDHTRSFKRAFFVDFSTAGKSSFSTPSIQWWRQIFCAVSSQKWSNTKQLFEVKYLAGNWQALRKIINYCPIPYDTWSQWYYNSCNNLFYLCNDFQLCIYVAPSCPKGPIPYFFPTFSWPFLSCQVKVQVVNQWWTKSQQLSYYPFSGFSPNTVIIINTLFLLCFSRNFLWPGKPEVAIWAFCWWGEALVFDPQQTWEENFCLPRHPASSQVTSEPRPWQWLATRRWHSHPQRGFSGIRRFWQYLKK